MTAEIKLRDENNGSPSEYLSMLIKSAVDNAVDFVTTWSEVLERGKYEGFSEKELRDMARPLFQEQLDQMGLTKKQINNKLYKLFNRKKVLEHDRQYHQDKRNSEYSDSKYIDHNNDIEQSSISDRIQELEEENEGLKEEIERLQTDLNDANETIRSMSFEENPDIFRINKMDPNSMVFTRMKISDAISILKGDVKAEELIDIAWRKSFIINDAKQDVRI